MVCHHQSAVRPHAVEKVPGSRHGMHPLGAPQRIQHLRQKAEALHENKTSP